MKIQATIITATFTSKWGTDAFVRLVKKDEEPEDVVEEMKDAVDYKEPDDDDVIPSEFFDWEMESVIIDTDDFEEVV